MTRPLRIDFPFALYHLTTRGNERRPIFRVDSDRRKFLDFLGETVRRFGWSLTAWVLMGNHYHLAVQTPEANLSRGMHWLNGTYAGWFNRRHKRAGHLFQGRFHGYFIERETYYAEVLRYVVLNPVRANLVGRPEDYPWSSFRQTVGLEAPAGWFDVDTALALFDTDQSVAKQMYRDFVMSRVDGQQRLWDQVRLGRYLGSEGWARQMRAHVEAWPRSTEHPIKHRAIGRPSMPAIIDAVSAACGVPAEDIRGGRGCRARELAAWLGYNEGLLSLRTIAASLRLRSEGHIATLIRRCEGEFKVSSERVAQLDRALVLVQAS